MSRESFLKRVQEAAEAGLRFRSHVRDDIPRDAGYIGGTDDPIAHLAEQVAAVGGRPHIADNLALAREHLAEILRQLPTKSALCWQHPLLDRLGLAELLSSLEVTQVDHDAIHDLEPDERRARMLAADIGISSVTYAVAETGTIAVASRPGQERLASLLPPVHVAIVEPAQIVPDLFDLFTRLEEAGLDQLPTNVSLITGPSKTGDIELQLTTGVHGPGTWHVIVLRDAR